MDVVALGIHALQGWCRVHERHAARLISSTEPDEHGEVPVARIQCKLLHVLDALAKR